MSVCVYRYDSVSMYVCVWVCCPLVDLSQHTEFEVAESKRIVLVSFTLWNILDRWTYDWKSTYVALKRKDLFKLFEPTGTFAFCNSRPIACPIFELRDMYAQKSLELLEYHMNIGNHGANVWLEYSDEAFLFRLVFDEAARRFDYLGRLNL